MSLLLSPRAIRSTTVPFGGSLFVGVPLDDKPQMPIDRVCHRGKPQLPLQVGVTSASSSVVRPDAVDRPREFVGTGHGNRREVPEAKNIGLYTDPFDPSRAIVVVKEGGVRTGIAPAARLAKPDAKKIVNRTSSSSPAPFFRTSDPQLPASVPAMPSRVSGSPSPRRNADTFQTLFGGTVNIPSRGESPTAAAPLASSRRFASNSCNGTSGTSRERPVWAEGSPSLLVAPTLAIGRFVGEDFKKFEGKRCSAAKNVSNVFAAPTTRTVNYTLIAPFATDVANAKTKGSGGTSTLIERNPNATVGSTQLRHKAMPVAAPRPPSVVGYPTSLLLCQ